MQYEAWLRREPFRRCGWDSTQAGLGRSAGNRQKTTRTDSKKQAELTSVANEEDGCDGGHMPLLSNVEYSDLIREKPRSEDLRDSLDRLHESGKVKGMVGKREEKEAHLSETASGMPVT